MTGTKISSSTADSITIRGHDLVDELIGRRDFVEVAFLQINGRLPSPAERRMVDAILVTVADHGLTPSVLAARLTRFGAPESLQGAVAAGLLGAGDTILGAMQNAAELFAATVKRFDLRTGADFPAAAKALVDEAGQAGRKLPGYGHPIHVDGDPRVPRLIAVAGECGLVGPHLRLAEAVGDILKVQKRPLPMNAAAAIGGIIADMGIPPIFARGLALIGRTAGLIAHLVEEDADPMARDIWARSDPAVQPRKPRD